MSEEYPSSHYLAPRVVAGFDSSGIENIREPGSRTGDAHRARAAAHVRAMIQAGYLTGEEGGARCNMIEKSTTAYEVNRLISDLPAMPAPRRFDWENPQYYVPVLLATLAASVITVILPWLVLNALNESDSAWGVAVIVTTVVAGVVGVISSVVSMATKAG